jgi:hypothetical protein
MSIDGSVVQQLPEPEQPELEPAPEPQPEPEPEPELRPIIDAPADSCPTAVLADVLDAVLFERARRDFFRVVESEFEPPYKEDSFTSGTYWFSLPAAGEAAAPRNAIEAAAVSISRSAPFRELVDVGRVAGVEWWFQEQGAEDTAKDYHTDCDVQIKRGTDGQDDVVIERRPALSSVFYLDDFGGPTVVFGQTEVAAGLSPRWPTRAVASFPHPNQLFVFRGDLFHGVLATTQPNPTERSRFTLLYNWWLDRPHGPADLPACFAFDDTDAARSEQVASSCSNGNDSVTEGEISPRRREHVEWGGSSGSCAFSQSGHLPAWRAQQLPEELASVARSPGAPLHIAYGGGNAEEEEAGRGEGGGHADEENWTEAG